MLVPRIGRLAFRGPKAIGIATTALLAQRPASRLAIDKVLTVSQSPALPKPEDASDKRHHGRIWYKNPWLSAGHGEILATVVSAYRIATRKANYPVVALDTEVPIMDPEFLVTRTTPNLRATWLGHSCYLVEFPNGLRVLFDPVWEMHCVRLVGPKRISSPPCGIRDIPFIDAVIISHNHYDHLSYTTITEISKLYPSCHFFVPLGVKRWFARSGISNVTELDWWQDRDITLTLSMTSAAVLGQGRSIKSKEIKARLSCLPCQHGSGRGLFDQGRSLWSSWAIEGGGVKVYFAGDTGYRTVPMHLQNTEDQALDLLDPPLPVCPAFQQIGRLRGPFDLGLIPIGAYGPRWLTSPQHANPYEAVKIYQEIRCRRALAMHWGTWALTEEAVLAPPKDLKTALRKTGLPETGVFDTCSIGESREFSSRRGLVAEDEGGAGGRIGTSLGAHGPPTRAPRSRLHHPPRPKGASSA